MHLQQMIQEVFLRQRQTSPGRQIQDQSAFCIAGRRPALHEQNALCQLLQKQQQLPAAVSSTMPACLTSDPGVHVKNATSSVQKASLEHKSIKQLVQQLALGVPATHRQSSSSRKKNQRFCQILPVIGGILTDELPMCKTLKTDAACHRKDSIAG